MKSWARSLVVIGTAALLAVAYIVSHIEPSWATWAYVAATAIGLVPVCSNELGVKLEFRQSR
jgi:Cd2+/Zn2+-exporting ATPase